MPAHDASTTSGNLTGVVEASLKAADTLEEARASGATARVLVATDCHVANASWQEAPIPTPVPVKPDDLRYEKEVAGQVLKLVNSVIAAHAAAIIFPAVVGSEPIPPITSRGLVGFVAYGSSLVARLATFLSRLCVLEEVQLDLELAFGMAPLIGCLYQLVIRYIRTDPESSARTLEDLRLFNVIASCLAVKAMALAALQLVVGRPRDDSWIRFDKLQAALTVLFAWVSMESMSEVVSMAIQLLPMVFAMTFAPITLDQVAQHKAKQEAMVRKQEDAMEMAFTAMISIGASGGKDEGLILESSPKFDKLVFGKAQGRPLSDFVTATLMHMLQFWSAPEPEEGQVSRRLLTTLCSKCGKWRQDVELRCLVTAPKLDARGKPPKKLSPRLIGVIVLGEVRSFASDGTLSNLRKERSTTTLIERRGFEAPKVTSQRDGDDGDGSCLGSALSSTFTGSVNSGSNFRRGPVAYQAERTFNAEDAELSEVAPSDSASHVARNYMASAEGFGPQDNVKYGKILMPQAIWQTAGKAFGHGNGFEVGKNVGQRIQGQPPPVEPDLALNSAKDLARKLGVDNKRQQLLQEVESRRDDVRRRRPP